MCYKHLQCQRRKEKGLNCGDRNEYGHIKYLAEQSDHIIFEFDDLMRELLYHLDTEKLAEQCEKADLQMCDDTFLYSRCVALINGPD